MRSFAIAAGLFAVASLATPINLAVRGEEPCDENAAPCMTYDQASTVANNFADLIKNYSNASAIAYLTPDFTDYSDSVDELINNGCPNGPATVSRNTSRFCLSMSNTSFSSASQPSPPAPRSWPAKARSQISLSRSSTCGTLATL
jgi:hypothetical protein